MSKTKVVNVHNYPCESKRTISTPLPFIYVGREIPNRFDGHPLANPFRLPREATHEDRVECIEKYREWLLIRNRERLWKHIEELAEQVKKYNLPLGCWCSPLLCHADVLAEQVDSILGR